MSVYKIEPKNTKFILKNNMKRVLPVTTIAIIFGLGIGFIQNPNVFENPILIVIVLLITVGSISFGFLLGKRMLVKNGKEVQFEISESKIIYRINGIEKFLVDKSQITKIEKMKDGNIMVATAINPKKIIFTKYLSNFNQLEVELSALMPIINSKHKPFNWGYVSGTVTVLCYSTIKLSNDRILVSLAGIIFSVGLVISIFFIWNNKLVNKQTKLLSLVSIIPVIDAIYAIIKINNF